MKIDFNIILTRLYIYYLTNQISSYFQISDSQLQKMYPHIENMIVIL